MANISLGNIRYNPTTGAYEARVDIDRKGRTYRYPCSVAGALTMDEAAVRQSLSRQALKLAGREGGLHAVR
ncbi:orotidine 5'-phosphate decarboxylase [Octadecabacter sp. 1_MG-2023]|uniref:orotidine 5'-phosphate decarboxylase n=1 Tax=unclassified Octadecabacter TaxID=196158 RepID=UPI001C0A57F9|nr:MULTISPECIES: orotidine 5'-phosphate decarboxylase [unclassified Octadecabacter]MBU2992086.1 orotidine 5'-phosphate decarboxylase [Octadecabacter sp. B2R22]MDO6735157.1 orotidine 5'-phosphate decarboxylase [Octadecabacter sp. 1_MG-2023]